MNHNPSILGQNPWFTAAPLVPALPRHVEGHEPRARGPGRALLRDDGGRGWWRRRGLRRGGRGRGGLPAWEVVQDDGGH